MLIGKKLFCLFSLFNTPLTQLSLIPPISYPIHTSVPHSPYFIPHPHICSSLSLFHTLSTICPSFSLFHTPSTICPSFPLFHTPSTHLSLIPSSSFTCIETTITSALFSHMHFDVLYRLICAYHAILFPMWQKFYSVTCILNKLYTILSSLQ